MWRGGAEKGSRWKYAPRDPDGQNQGFPPKTLKTGPQGIQDPLAPSSTSPKSVRSSLNIYKNKLANFQKGYGSVATRGYPKAPPPCPTLRIVLLSLTAIERASSHTKNLNLSCDGFIFTVD